MLPENLRTRSVMWNYRSKTVTAYRPRPDEPDQAEKRKPVLPRSKPFGRRQAPCVSRQPRAETAVLDPRGAGRKNKYSHRDQDIIRGVGRSSIGSMRGAVKTPTGVAEVLLTDIAVEAFRSQIEVAGP